MDDTTRTKVEFHEDGCITWSEVPLPGRWIIGGRYRVAVWRKPNWLHRKMARLLLGWEWEDFPNKDTEAGV